MIKKEFTVVSNYDALALKGVIYEPEGTPKGLIQFVHGMVEYKIRYEAIMQFCAKNGYVAACHDQRGHGESVESDNDLGWFRDFSGKAIVEDCAQVTKYLKSQYPDLKVTLFGHSMGSMVVRCYLREHDDLIDKLVVCGSPSNNPMSGMAIFLTKCIRLFKGQRHRSPLLSYLSTGKDGKEFEKAGKGSWLTRDMKVVEAYAADPKCGYIFTVNGYENLFNMMKRTYTKRGYKVQNPTLPIHFIAGSDDPVIVSDLKWFNAIEFLRKVGYERVSGKLYENMRHEVLNEIGKEEVYSDLLAFMGA